MWERKIGRKGFYNIVIVFLHFYIIFFNKLKWLKIHLIREGIWQKVEGESILVFYCSITSYQKFSILKQAFIISHFAWINVWGWLRLGPLFGVSWGCSQSFSRALVSSEPWGSLQSSCDCYPNLFPFLCRTPGCFLLQDQQETVLLQEGLSPLLRLYLIKAGPLG